MENKTLLNVGDTVKITTNLYTAKSGSLVKVAEVIVIYVVEDSEGTRHRVYPEQVEKTGD